MLKLELRMKWVLKHGWEGVFEIVEYRTWPAHTCNAHIRPACPGAGATMLLLQTGAPLCCVQFIHFGYSGPAFTDIFTDLLLLRLRANPHVREHYTTQAARGVEAVGLASVGLSRLCRASRLD